MIKWKKYICVALSAVMMASLATGCGDTNDSSSSDKAEATTESESAGDPADKRSVKTPSMEFVLRTCYLLFFL